MNTPEQKQRIKQLNKILFLARIERDRPPTAFLATAFGVAFGLIAGSIFDYGIPFEHSSISVILISAILFGVIGYKFKRKNYILFIYDWLAAYQPVDTSSYHSLQVIASNGALNAQQIIEWVDVERAAVCPAAESKSDLARKAFASKQLTAQPQD